MKGTGSLSIRSVFATVVLALSAAALVVEMTTHLCASALFDPLPDGSTTVAYWFVAAMLLFNEYALAIPRRPRTWLQEERLWGAAMTGTAVCLPLVAATIVMILPILPISYLLIPFYGLGLLAWAPLLVFLIFITQFCTLCRRWREDEGGVPTRERVTALLCGLIAFGWFVVRPIAVGCYLDAALSQEAEVLRRIPFSRTLGLDAAVLDIAYGSQPPYWVAFGRSPSFLPYQQWPSETEVTRAQAYYRLLTGRPYDSVPPPVSVQRGSSAGD